jgi:hypothetical protein
MAWHDPEGHAFPGGNPDRAVPTVWDDDPNPVIGTLLDHRGDVLTQVGAAAHAGCGVQAVLAVAVPDAAAERPHTAPAPWTCPLAADIRVPQVAPMANLAASALLGPSPRRSAGVPAEPLTH